MYSSETSSTFTTWVANLFKAFSFTKKPALGTELVKAQIPAPVINSHFILDFAQHLEKAGLEGNPTLHSDCIVCRRTLDISSCVGDLVKAECDLAGEPTAAKTKKQFYDKHGLERTIVLRCGHLIGEECLRDALEFYQSGDPGAMRPNVCFHCRAKATCDGCDDMLLADDQFHPFVANTAWPLGASDARMHQPWMGFQRVALTAAEKDPEAKRYCRRCTYYQILRKFSDCALTFPACQTFASAEDCRQWLRQRVHEASRLVCPVTDVRNRRLAAQKERFLARGRDYIVETCLGGRGRSAKLHGTVFCPCMADIEALSPKRLRGFKSKQKRRLRDTNVAFEMADGLTGKFMAIADTLPLTWYRGAEEEEGARGKAAVDFDSSRPRPTIRNGPSIGASASSGSWEGTRSLTRSRGSIPQSSKAQSCLDWWRALTSGSSPMSLRPTILLTEC
ncbi:hypothetical protein PG993_012600 [Apiospora rasikravindrae]|uniref:RING-type domain-containing protein n=1 Tax=Apiospora rasikravindrae TaxID=990691 RepID=A0ABR1S2X1_9PEZI